MPVDLQALKAKIAAQRHATQALADKARTLVSGGSAAGEGQSSSGAAQEAPPNKEEPPQKAEVSKTTFALATPSGRNVSPEAMRSPVTPFGQALRQVGPTRSDRGDGPSQRFAFLLKLLKNPETQTGRNE